MADNGEVIVTDRRHLSLREISFIVLFLMNFGGIVWGVAKISTTVSDLTAATTELKNTTKGLATDITQIKIDYLSRISVLENRVAANERVILDLNKKVRGF